MSDTSLLGVCGPCGNVLCPNDRAVRETCCRSFVNDRPVEIILSNVPGYQQDLQRMESKFAQLESYRSEINVGRLKEATIRKKVTGRQQRGAETTEPQVDILQVRAFQSPVHPREVR